MKSLISVRIITSIGRACVCLESMLMLLRHAQSVRLNLLLDVPLPRESLRGIPKLCRYWREREMNLNKIFIVAPLNPFPDSFAYAW